MVVCVAFKERGGSRANKCMCADCGKDDGTFDQEDNMCFGISDVSCLASLAPFGLSVTLAVRADARDVRERSVLSTGNEPTVWADEVEGR